MALGKRLINTGGVAACNTDSTDPFGDSSGVALYNLDYDASTAPDGTDYSGTPTDVDFGVDGHINWGARFNGSSSKIEVSDPVIPNGASSISFWYNPSGATGVEYIIGNGIATASKGISVAYTGSTGIFTVFILKGVTTLAANFSGTTAYSNTDWHNVSVAWDGTTTANAVKLYVNGSLEAEGTSNTSSTSIGSYTTFGIGGINGGAYGEGSIDQVRIFSKALNQTEVDTLYAETACVYTATTTDNDYPTTNLAYYKLDNSAEDEKVSYDGTETDVTYEFGRFGTAAVFDGSNSKIVTTLNANGFSQIAISCWINTSLSSGTGSGHIVSANDGTNWCFLSIVKSTGIVTFGASNGGSSIFSATHTGAINDGNWHHIAGSYNGTNATLYIDGVGYTPVSATASLSVNVGFGIGYRNTAASSGTYFDGSIDQVRIFSSALTSSQVEGLFNDEKQAYITKSASDPFGDSSEVAFYKMENNSNDSTGSNDGSDPSMTYSTSDALFDSYSAVFDGSSSIITTSLNKSSYSSLSYSVWIKTSSTSQQRIIDASSGTGQNKQCLFTRFDGSKGIRYISIGDDFYDTANLNSLLGDWFHVVVTDGGGDDVNLYINGELVTFTKVLSNGGYFNPSNTLFGAGRKSTNDIGNYFSGDLDQVRIFDRALEGDEVFKLYAEVIN